MKNVKKLLYIFRYPIDQEFNLKSKFDGQLIALKRIGFDVYYIVFDREHLYLIHNDERIVYGKTHFGFPLYMHISFYNDLHKAVIKVLNNVGMDYVYWRSAPLFSSSCKVAKTAKETGAKLIIEESTFPPDAQKDGIRKLFYLYSDRYIYKFNSCVNVYAVIGEDAKGQYLGKPAINIENGIDVNRVRVRKPKNDKEVINILALASMNYWHGYERIIKSLGDYKGTQRVIIHMVGGNDGGCLPEWKELAHQLNLDDKVLFHGPLSGKALDEMFDLCDIGVNSLAMYKKGFNVTMELKAREYIARGLPFICTVDDPALSYAEKPMWMRIPNDDSVPDMNEIVDFALKMKNDPDHVQLLRNLAEEHMTWEQQFIKVFELLEGEK